MRRGARSPMRRGPGLLGAIGRTAVIAGTATAVSNSISRSMDAPAQQALAQQQAHAAPQPQPAPASSSSCDSQITKLQQLAELKRQGILSEDEFAAEKERILAS